ncbi:MAG: hypothetical protein ACLTMP_08280 [Eggerthella lenta]
MGSILAGLKMKGYTRRRSRPWMPARVISLTDEGTRFCEQVFASLHRLESEACRAPTSRTSRPRPARLTRMPRRSAAASTSWTKLRTIPAPARNLRF